MSRLPKLQYIKRISRETYTYVGRCNLLALCVSKGKPNKPYTRLSVSFVNSVVRTHFDGEYNLISVILQYNIFHFLALKNSNFTFLTIISRTITQHLVRSNRIKYIYIKAIFCPKRIGKVGTFKVFV